MRDGDQEGASGAPPPCPATENLVMDTACLQEAAQNTCAGGMPRSASKLMMAFRDVTVQIDNHNFRLSSSVLESVSLGNGVSKETSSKPQAGGQNTGQSESSVTAEPEFPAPPTSEEIELDQRSAGGEVEPAMAGLEKPQAKLSVSEVAENSSDPISSSSTSTSACETMILTLPRTHCPDTHCGTLSTDIARKRLYRIGLNLFNM